MSINSNKIKSKKAISIDLTDSQKGLMYIIKEYKELPIDSFQMNKRALSQLMKKGYITAFEYANGRFVSLTDSGNEIMEYLAKNE